MRRAGAPALLLVLLIVIAAPVHAQGTKQGTKPSERGPRPLAVAATPIESFSRSEPERVRFGALEFRGGLVLEADEAHFGGLSGIRAIGGDEDFLAITDRGRWLRFRLRLDNGRPAGIERAMIAPMLDGSGAALSSTASFDTEALALGEGGDVHVGIERTHRVVRFDFGRREFIARARGVATPPAMRDLPRNAGVEGLVFVPPGRPLGGALIAFSERGLDAAGNLRAFILGGPAPGEFAVRRRNNFDITDAALLPGGDVVILERYFSWLGGIGMRIRLIPLADIRPGALVDGAVLIEAGNAHQIDNMEGLAAHRNAAGETVLTVVSDDNFSRLQRTLLLRFALVED